MSHFLDLTGQRFGRLVALSWMKRENRTWWVLKCDCGNTTEVRLDSLRSDSTQSCGCINVETARRLLTAHGLSKIPGYSCWVSMNRRCSEPTAVSYPRYGAIGIKVCDQWRADFANFLADMGPRPSKEHSLDRFPDLRGNYEPGNVRWATRKQQARSKRNTVMVDYARERAPLIDICERIGRDYNNVRQRIKVYGWSVERALA